VLLRLLSQESFAITAVTLQTFLSLMQLATPALTHPPAYLLHVPPTSLMMMVRPTTDVKLDVPQWWVPRRVLHARLPSPRVRPLALPLLLAPSTGLMMMVRPATDVKLDVPQWRVPRRVLHARLLPPRVHPLALPLLLAPPTSLMMTVRPTTDVKLDVLQWLVEHVLPALLLQHVPLLLVPPTSLMMTVRPTTDVKLDVLQWLVVLYPALPVPMPPHALPLRVTLSSVTMHRWRVRVVGTCCRRAAIRGVSLA